MDTGHNSSGSNEELKKGEERKMRKESSEMKTGYETPGDFD